MGASDSPSVDECIDWIESCINIVQLYTVADKIAKIFAGNDEMLELFSDLCVHKLSQLPDSNVTHEALIAGGLKPYMVVGGVLAEA